MHKNIVKFNAFRKLIWPHFCSLCLKPAAEKGSLSIGGGRVPYCDRCYDRVKRLERWNDNIFGISFFIGILGGVLYFFYDDYR